MVYDGSVAVGGSFAVIGFGVFQESTEELVNRDIFLSKAEFISSDFDFGILQSKLSDLLRGPNPPAYSTAAGVDINVPDSSSFIDSSHIRRPQLVTI